MQTFAEYKRTPNYACWDKDTSKDDWILAPCARYRDSDCLQESNFHATLKRLGGESETVCVIRDSHWAVGWVEHILAHPSHKAELAKIEKELDVYPVLDEDDFSEREEDERHQLWCECGGSEDFATALGERFDLSERAWNVLSDAGDMTYAVATRFAHCNEDKPEWLADRIPDRDYVAALIHACRADKRGKEVDWKRLEWRKAED